MGGAGSAAGARWGVRGGGVRWGKWDDVRRLACLWDGMQDGGAARDPGEGKAGDPALVPQHIPQQEGACGGLEKGLSEGTGGCGKDAGGEEQAWCRPGLCPCPVG